MILDKSFEIRSTINTLFPKGLKSPQDKDEVRYALLMQVSRKLQYIPEGTLLYEKGVSLTTGIKTNKVQWWSSAPHYYVIPNYKVEYDFVSCDVDMIDRMKFLELDKLTSPLL